MSGEVKDFKADKIATAKQVPKSIVKVGGQAVLGRQAL